MTDFHVINYCMREVITDNNDVRRRGDSFSHHPWSGTLPATILSYHDHRVWTTELNSLVACTSILPPPPPSHQHWLHQHYTLSTSHTWLMGREAPPFLHNSNILPLDHVVNTDNLIQYQHLPTHILSPQVRYPHLQTSSSHLPWIEMG